MGYKIVASLLKLGKVVTQDDHRKFQYVKLDFSRSKIFFNQTSFSFNEEKPRESLYTAMVAANVTDPVIMTYIAQEGHQNGFLNVASTALVSLGADNQYQCSAEMKRGYFTTKDDGKVDYREEAAIFIARDIRDADICLKSEASISDVKMAKGNPNALLRVELNRPDRVYDEIESKQIQKVYDTACQNLETLLAGKAGEAALLQAETELQEAILSRQVSVLKPLVVLKANSTISSKEGKVQHTYHKPEIEIEPNLGTHLVKNKLSFADKLFINIKNSVESMVTRFNNWWGSRKQSVAAAPVQPAIISGSSPEAMQVVEPATPVLNA